MSLEVVVAALRSGKYRQGAGYLRRGDCYCAEGVIADVIDPNGWEPTLFDDGEPIYAWHGSVKWLLGGYLRSVLGNTLEGGVAALATANDKGMSFADIADALEAGTLVSIVKGL
jgi:hypothetical protein